MPEMQLSLSSECRLSTDTGTIDVGDDLSVMAFRLEADEDR